MYGDKYLCIGRDHHGEGDQQHHNTADVHHHLIHGLVTTGQPQHRGSLAEEVVDLVGGTERETHGNGGEEKTVQSATEPRAGQNKPADPPTHEDRVTEWIADSHVAVIGHKSQQEELSSYKAHVKKVLGCTGSKGDGPFAHNVIYQYLRHNSGDVHHVNERKMAEEEIHGRVEVSIYVNEKDHDSISHYGHKERGTNNTEKESWCFVVGKEPHEGEVTGKSFISIHMSVLELEA